ncbi:hypothetical protein E2C01_043133 [Portunus trituberculatus]|uniref:Uncharacterized protein n=1 Tax=Portunus trituberculatus TaxID=210409 RepID=A0A5B7FVH1_PORTR|nr:hypothetical protein [Portunus trituberculatus]
MKSGQEISSSFPRRRASCNCYRVNCRHNPCHSSKNDQTQEQLQRLLLVTALVHSDISLRHSYSA